MSVAALVHEHRGELTPAERRVAEVALALPQEVAFGTVAEVAERAGTSGATVVRLAAKLGLDGFSELQSLIQGELAQRLRPAAERIRERPPAAVVEAALVAELDNVQATLEALSREAFDAAVEALARPGRHVFILPGEASRGIGVQFADELSMLRPGVELLHGTDVRLARAAADLGPGDTVVVIDLRRYERWVLDTVAGFAEQGAWVVALSDSPLSPLADLASLTLVVRAEGSGPFDSHVGTLALANALVAGVAARLQVEATDRLDRIEAAWRRAGSLVEG